MKNNIRLLGLPLLALLFLASLPVFAYTMPDAGTRSPRPTLTPTAVSPTVAPKEQTAVAAIILIADGDVKGVAMDRLTTAVQWQDDKGKWHTVEGWQAPFNMYKQVTWAVAKEHYGKGAFRWLILDGDSVIDSTPTFYLPSSTHETVRLHIGGQ